MDNTFEEDILSLEEEIVRSEGKRKFEDLPEEQKPSKVLKLWNFMKYPFNKITIGTSIYSNESNISDAVEVDKKEEESSIPETNMYKKKSDMIESDEINYLNNDESQPEVENTSENTINKQKFCIVM